MTDNRAVIVKVEELAVGDLDGGLGDNVLV